MLTRKHILLLSLKYAAQYLKKVWQPAKPAFWTFGNISESFGNVAESFRNVLESFGNVPESFGNATKSFGNVPGSLGNATVSFGNVPESFRNAPKSIGNVAESFCNVSELFGDATKSFGNVPESCGNVPEPFDNVPGLSVKSVEAQRKDQRRLKISSPSVCKSFLPIAHRTVRKWHHHSILSVVHFQTGNAWHGYLFVKFMPLLRGP